jgi:imidazolonepropionase-like amidohydrolase
LIKWHFFIKNLPGRSALYLFPQFSLFCRFKTASDSMDYITKTSAFLFITLLLSHFLPAQTPPQQYLLQPDRVFDGEQVHEGWQVLVEGNQIQAIGPALKTNRSTQIIELPGTTLLPGLIEGHSHLLLHPYNETPWTDQVLRESLAERAIRAGKHAEATLMAGFTTVRDLGTEGADYEDVGIAQTIEKGVISGPRMLVATKAIVATGSYKPDGFRNPWEVPLGAEETSGTDGIMETVRSQIKHGADVIKLYGDYRWGPNGEAMPTFTLAEMKAAVEVAHSSGRTVAVHAATAEGMRRAIEAGANTIEHGDGGTPEIFQLMAENNVALCPTISAGEAISEYQGWQRGSQPYPERVVQKRQSFRQALDAGVTICMGGDVGVYTHGDNAREMEAMVDYGMSPLNTLRSATSINADAFQVADKIGRIREGMLADILVVEGNPAEDISALRNVKLVMKDGKIYRHEQ